MLPANRTPTHSGEILAEEFLKPLELTQVALAKNIGVPAQRVNEIVRGKRGITPETAWLLTGAFETTPNFWIDLQTHYDLATRRPDRHVECGGSGDGFGPAPAAATVPRRLTASSCVFASWCDVVASTPRSPAMRAVLVEAPWAASVCAAISSIGTAVDLRRTTCPTARHSR